MGGKVYRADSRSQNLVMIFRELPLQGAFTIDLDLITDERGFFARSWCMQEFQARGLDARLVQCNVSYNKVKGTLRGMHYQVAPAAEVKVVRCTSGAIYDVIVDLRPDSPTFKRSLSVLLSAESHRMLYIPQQFAHGFLTLSDNTEVMYHMSEFYAPSCARGFRWDDPTFGISWPEQVKVISAKDRNYPDFAG